MAIQEQELQHTYHSIVDNLQSLRENLTNLQLNEIQYENEELQQTLREGKNVLNNLIQSEFYLNTLSSFKKLQISKTSASSPPSSSLSKRKQETNTNLKSLSPNRKQKRHESYSTL